MMYGEPDFGEEFNTEDARRADNPAAVSLARDYIEARDRRQKRKDQHTKLKGPQRERSRRRPHAETAKPTEIRWRGRTSNPNLPQGGGGGRGGGGGGGGDA